jgi:putative transcription antitermination factor YqgF
MNILAIDFGTKRLGIAVGDTETGIAFPRDGIENTTTCPPLLKEGLGEIFLENKNYTNTQQADTSLPTSPFTKGGSFPQILTLCQQEKIARVLVGLPLMPAGTDSKETENARRFAEDLEDFLLHHDCDIPVDFTDERFSSKTAQQAAQAAGKSQKQSRGNLDSAAAAIFLQQYLDGC